MSDRNKILDRIGKLFAKAESAEEFGSVAEAEAFAAKGQEMLLQHKIGDTELAEHLAANDEERLFAGMATSYYRPRDWGHARQHKRSLWREQLARVIAQGFQCENIVVTRSNFMMFAGLEADTIFCVQLYARLVDLFERESLRHYDREYNKLYTIGADTSPMRGYKASWLEAASRGLKHRLDEQLAAMVTGTALIRLKDVVTRFVDKDTVSAAKLSPARNHNRGGAEDGFAFGRGIGLHQEVDKSDTKGLHS